MSSLNVLAVSGNAVSIVFFFHDPGIELFAPMYKAMHFYLFSSDFHNSTPHYLNFFIQSQKPEQNTIRHKSKVYIFTPP